MATGVACCTMKNSYNIQAMNYAKRRVLSWQRKLSRSETETWLANEHGKEAVG